MSVIVFWKHKVHAYMAIAISYLLKLSYIVHYTSMRMNGNEIQNGG